MIGYFGVLSNIALIYTTIRARSLHGTCNWLLALAAASDVVHQAGHVFPMYNVVSGRNFIELRTCFFLQLASLTGLSMMIAAMVFIALVRLASVLFPIV